jgi:hypothetical protein
VTVPGWGHRGRDSETRERLPPLPAPPNRAVPTTIGFSWSVGASRIAGMHAALAPRLQGQRCVPSTVTLSPVRATPKTETR